MSFESSSDSSTFFNKKTTNARDKILPLWSVCYSKIYIKMVALIFTDTEMNNEYGYANDMAKSLLCSMQWKMINN